MLSNTNLMWILLLTSPFWSGTGISLKEDPSVIREMDIQGDRRSRNKLFGRVRESFLRSRRKSTRTASREIKSPAKRVKRERDADACGYTLTSCGWSKSYTRKKGKKKKATCILRASPSVNGKWRWPAGKYHFLCWGDLPLKWKGQQVWCEDMGELKPTCHYGGWTWLSKTQCVLCRIKTDCVQPVIFEGQTVTGRSYLEMLSNWLIPQLAAERHDCLFSKMGRHRTDISLSARFSTSACQTDGSAALDKMTMEP